MNFHEIFDGGMPWDKKVRFAIWCLWRLPYKVYDFHFTENFFMLWMRRLGCKDDIAVKTASHKVLCPCVVDR